MVAAAEDRAGADWAGDPQRRRRPVRPGTELSVIQEAHDAIVALPVEGRLDDGVG